ncbi:MAG: DNA translocase FtsK 4TM domain-containing protein, partial [Bauldia sp.]
MRSSRSISLSVAGEGAARRIVRRNLSAFLGLAVLALAAAVAASLATWAVSDPSLSHATDGATRNILGFPGAIVADLLTQFFGLAACLVLVPPITWAWRVVFASPSPFGWLRLTTWLAGCLTATLALAAFPLPSSWPLPTGLGGVSGDLLMRIPAAVLGGEPAGWTAVATGALFAGLAFALVLHACGLILWRQPLSPGDETAVPAVRPAERIVAVDDEFVDDDFDAPGVDDGEPPAHFSLALGILAHLALRAAGRLRRLVYRRGIAHGAVLTSADLARREPTVAADDAWLAGEDEVDIAEAAAP